MSLPIKPTTATWQIDPAEYQRRSLLAASHGIWCQPMSQIVQVTELKEEVASLIPETGLVPQHPFRMGYAPAEKQHTPRRSIAEVLV